MSPQDQAKEQTEQATQQQSQQSDFHGAAIIDQKGREIPITEEMVQKACQELEEAAESSAAE